MFDGRWEVVEVDVPLEKVAIQLHNFHTFVEFGEVERAGEGVGRQHDGSQGGREVRDIDRAGEAVTSDVEAHNPICHFCKIHWPRDLIGTNGEGEGGGW